jgi:hypothetical protein
MEVYVTTKDLESALDKQTDLIYGVVETFMNQDDKRFNKVEKNIEDIKTSIIWKMHILTQHLPSLNYP